MNLEECKSVFAVTVLGLTLVAAFPTVSMVLPFPSGGERFSELWLLGPDHMAEGYPFNVRGGEVQGPIYVGVSNHMGSSEYYVVYVKFRNQTQPLPNATASEPSPLLPLYEFQFFLADGETWETPLFFTVEDVLFQDDTVSTSRISINDVVSSVNASTKWDSGYSGFYYQLFFELWLYSRDLQTFQFHDRFVGIWLNMTVF